MYIQAPLGLTTRSVANTTSPAFKVVCAYPVSGQYGAGSRILYYVLVITCIFARKAEWLKTACLAAALVFPAVASIHALVLAGAHVNGAVDMDIYGAFQFCSIAILAAPLTVRLSRTYFYDPGRNIIFLWTILILAGLVALCVEFYRVTPVDCTRDDADNAISLGTARFPYGKARCGLTCSEQDGPFSPLRGGAASEIYVIPVPHRLTFNATMLLAAGLCIPAILSLIFTWDKILEINWKERSQQTEDSLQPVEGANVTVGEMSRISKKIRLFLSVAEVPVFGGAVVAILGIGEANFFSDQVSYQTEPMRSIGQWAPIAGTALAALGSLYLLWFPADEPINEPMNEQHKLQQRSSNSSTRERHAHRDPSPGNVLDMERTVGLGLDAVAMRPRSLSPADNRIIQIITTHSDDEREVPDDTPQQISHDEPTAGRRRVRKWFTKAGIKLGNAAHQKLDVSDYNDQKAHRFPAVPGEDLRNPALERVSMQYTELRRQNSKAGSNYTPSIVSTFGIEATSPPLSHGSPLLETSPALRPARRDTLEVPTQVHLHRRSDSS